MKTASQGHRKQSHTGIQVECEASARVAGHDRNQFVDQMTVRLKEGSRADLIFVLFASIANRSRARLGQLFWIGHFIFFPPAPGREKRHSADSRQLVLKSLRPA